MTDSAIPIGPALIRFDDLARLFPSGPIPLRAAGELRIVDVGSEAFVSLASWRRMIAALPSTDGLAPRRPRRVAIAAPAIAAAVKPAIAA